MLNLWKANINCGCNECFYHEFQNWIKTSFYFYWQKHVIKKYIELEISIFEVVYIQGYSK